MEEGPSEPKKDRTIPIVGIIMFLACAFTPALVMPAYSYYGGGGTSINYMVYALLWSYIPDYWQQVSKFTFLDPTSMVISFPFTLPMLIFAYGVVRYTQNRISLARLIGSAILSILVPLLITISYFIFVISNGGLGYVGPVPIHLLIGVLIIKKVKQPEVTPWEGVKESHWWEE
ncbi:MAG: hypothetical protein ACTSYL_07555 [Candidatus Thorarchaeota archaeon]